MHWDCLTCCFQGLYLTKTCRVFLQVSLLKGLEQKYTKTTSIKPCDSATLAPQVPSCSKVFDFPSSPSQRDELLRTPSRPAGLPCHAGRSRSAGTERSGRGRWRSQALALGVWNHRRPSKSLEGLDRPSPG